MTAKIILLALVCLLIGYLLGKKSSKNSVANVQQAEQLKTELNEVHKQNETIKTQLNEAISSAQNLALNWAQVYKTLELTKNVVEGKSTGEEKIALQIKNGKIEKIPFNDEAIIDAKLEEVEEDNQEEASNKEKETSTTEENLSSKDNKK